MTFYTPIAFGAAADDDTFNGPLGQLDNAIAGLKDGDIAFEQITLAAGAVLEIAGGTIAIEHSLHYVDTEGGASADNLDLITGYVEGDLLLLQAVSGARVVTVRHNAGNIKLAGEAHVVLDNQNKTLLLFYDGATWCEVGAGAWSNKLSIGNDTTLTIAAGVITIVRSHHAVDTQGAAATDNLDTINGGDDGNILVLHPVSSARVTTIRHGIGNILMRNGNDLVLDDLDTIVAFFFDNGYWHELAAEGALLATNPLDAAYVAVRKLRFPQLALRAISGVQGGYDVLAMPSPEVRDMLRIKAYSTTFKSGDVDFTVTADSTAVNNAANGHYTQITTAATTSDAASLVTNVFNLVQTRWDPTFVATVKFDGGITNRRVWIGLFESTPGNTDNIGGAGVHGIGFRYSTNAADANWQLVCSSGAAQTVTDTGVAVAGATKYVLKLRVDETNGTVYASVNNSVEVSCATNLPANTDNMGIVAKVISLENATKGLAISQIYVEHD